MWELEKKRAKIYRNWEKTVEKFGELEKSDPVSPPSSVKSIRTCFFGFAKMTKLFSSLSKSMEIMLCNIFEIRDHRFTAKMTILFSNLSKSMDWNFKYIT